MKTRLILIVAIGLLAILGCSKESARTETANPCEIVEGHIHITEDDMQRASPYNILTDPPPAVEYLGSVKTETVNRPKFIRGRISSSLSEDGMWRDRSGTGLTPPPPGVVCPEP